MARTKSLPYAVFVSLTLALFLSPITRAQSEFSGKLDGRLHVDPADGGIAIFDAMSTDDAKTLGISAKPEDKVFSGVLSLPKKAVVQFKAVIVRSPDGSDVLYIDANRDGRFGTQERVLFYPLEPAVDRLKNSAALDVLLPDGPFQTCPMEVLLPNDGVPTPSGPTQLTVLYTSLAFVEGYAQLPKRKMLVRFEYDFKKQDIDLGSALELLDVNGDGKLDHMPGSAEFLRARGSAPVFRAGNKTLQVQSVDLKRNRFTLRSVPASSYQRIQLTVGSIMPDFEFTDFTGMRQRLSDVKGKYRLLDFWATWCRPCVEDLPIQKKAYEQFHGKGFEILGMNGDETLEEPEKLLRKQGIEWQQARLDKELYEDRFQISLWPTMILIDEHRMIISMGEAQHLPLDGEHLLNSLKSLIIEDPRAR